MAKLVTSNVSTPSNVAMGVINQNFTATKTAMENTLSRDGSAPNYMEADLDLNHNDVINVGEVSADRGSFDTLYLNGSLFPVDDGQDYVPYSNPLEFDGDTFADKLQAAIDAVSDSGGGQVLIPPPWQAEAGAVWDITKAVIPKSNVHICGMPGVELKISDNSLPFAIFEVENDTLENVRISDLILNPNRDGQSSATVQVGAIDLNDGQSESRNIWIDNVEITNFSEGYHGIHIKGCTGVRVTNCRIHDGGGGNLYHPIYLLRNSDVFVSSNEIWDIGLCQGIKVSGQPALNTKATVIGNIVDGGGTAQRCINVTDFLEAVVIGNTVSGATDIGIRIGNEEEDNNYFTVVGNTVKDSLYGIRATITDHGTIVGNTIIECWLAGISLRNVHYCTISANTITNLTTAADASGLSQIQIEDQLTPTSITITGNTLRCSLGSGTRYGIANLDTGAANVTIGSNSVAGTFTTDIHSVAAINQRVRAFGGSVQLDVLVKSGVPTTSDFADGTGGLAHDTGTGTTVMAVNIGGVIKTVALT